VSDITRPLDPASGQFPPPGSINSTNSSVDPNRPADFVITTPKVDLSPGADRTDEFSLSVSNVTGRPIRASLSLVPTEPAKVDWFTVTGETERAFALGATESFVVKVAVPPEVPAGSYAVRCDAVSEDQPQEVFTPGPTITMTVGAPPVKRKLPIIPIVVAAVVAVALVVGVIVFATLGGGKQVIDVTGIAGSDAIRTLTAAGFSTDPAAAVNAAQCDAAVATQDPAGGTEADDGSTVTLTFVPCQRIRVVPQLAQTAASNLGRIFPRVGLVVEVVQIGTSATCNPAVSQQIPAPGTRTSDGATVLVVVPAEPAGCNIVSALAPARPTRDLFFAAG
jgi:PASTA domain